MPVNFTNKPAQSQIAKQSIAQKPEAPAKAKRSRKKITNKGYSAAVYERLFQHVASGEDLTTACRRPGMPSPWTVRRRLAVDDVLNDQYLQAQKIRLHGLADQLVSLPDDAIAGYEKVTAADRLTASKQKGDNIKWLLQRGLAEYAMAGEEGQAVTLNIINSPDAQPATGAPAQVVPLQATGPQPKIVGLPAQSIAQPKGNDGDGGASHG
ncbi:terminase small subunit-like protein [Pseudomonas aeruginosa]